MLTLFTQMAIPIASYVTIMSEVIKKTTLIKWKQMSTYKDMQPLLSDGVFPKKHVSSTRSTKTENFYASIISQMMAYFKAPK